MKVVFFLVVFLFVVGIVFVKLISYGKCIVLDIILENGEIIVIDVSFCDEDFCVFKWGGNMIVIINFILYEDVIIFKIYVWVFFGFVFVVVFVLSFDVC